jgi:hypothetical protein
VPALTKADALGLGPAILERPRVVSTALRQHCRGAFDCLVNLARLGAVQDDAVVDTGFVSCNRNYGTRILLFIAE